MARDTPTQEAVPSSTEITHAVHRLIDAKRASWKKILQSVTVEEATFANVILPLAHADNAFASESNLLIFWASASPNADVRSASNQARSLIDDHTTEAGLDESMFQLVDAVVRRSESLNSEEARLLTVKHQLYERNGLLLPPGRSRQRLREIRLLVSQRVASFHSNLADADGALWYTRDELDGVPDRVLSTLEVGIGANEGKLKVTFRASHLAAVMRFAKQSHVRQQFFVANENHCPQNQELFRSIVVLRDEAARLLGYSSHASFKLIDRMARTSDTVQRFLEDLNERLTSLSLAESENLRKLKAKDLHSRGQPAESGFFLWDQPYYNRMMLELTHQVDPEKVSEWFPLQSVVERMLSVFDQIFSLKFLDVTEGGDGLLQNLSTCRKLNVWHQDVLTYAVFDKDEDDVFLGLLYMDLYERDGKDKKPAVYNLVPGFTYKDGTRQTPSTALLCSFSKPTIVDPSLLRHDEVYTLFHELGHSIHDIVSKTAYACFHGAEVAVDFGEAPSQMFEHWCWTPSTLKLLSRHYSSLSNEYLDLWQKSTAPSGSRIAAPEIHLPDDMIASLVNARYVNAAHFYLNQLRYAMFDMAIHGPTSHDDIQSTNISALFNGIRAKVYPPSGLESLGQGHEWGNGQTIFAHSMIEDYSAGYYCYMFSRVFAADMFESSFSADPMSSTEGRRFRYIVLEKGGSRDPMQMIEEFLGRQPESGAFHRGLANRTPDTGHVS